MTRIRSIKPELYRHVELFEAEQAANLPLRLAFTGLFICCDREGRFKWQASQLKLDILPYDNVDFEAVLIALKEHGFIIQYTANNKIYGAIPSWNNHQRPSRDEALSNIPAPSGSTFVYNQSPTQTLRLQIYERDYYHCLYCNEDLTHKARSICLDYVIPLSEQGTHRPSNLATSCKKCNARKTNRTPTEAGLPWPNGLGEGSDSLVTPQPRVPSSANAVSELRDPPLMGGQPPVNPPLTPALSSQTLPSAASDTPSALSDTPLRDGQLLSGVEREKEGEGEGEKINSIVEPSAKTSKEQEQKADPKKSIVVPARPGGSVSPDILFVFEVWKTTLGHPQAVLDDKRKAWIGRALKSGYSVLQLLDAIKGCSLTPHNMGKNDRGQRYDGLHVILKDADQIDRFIRNASAPPRGLSAANALSDSNAATLDSWLQDKLLEGEDNASE